MNLEQTRQQEIMHVFEKGARLYQLIHSTGYADLLDILEAEVVKFEFRLMNLPPGTENQLLRDTLSHARVSRSIFEQLQLRIQALISVGLEASVDAEQANYSGL